MSQPITAAEIGGRPSHDDLCAMIRRAINPTGYDEWGPNSAWVHEVGDDSAIVSMQGRNWRYPYTVAADGQSVSLGTPVPAKLSWQDVSSGEPPIQAHEGTMAFVTSLSGFTFGEGPATLEVCRDGSWDHPRFGKIAVTPELRESLVQNFTANVRKVGELPLDYDHREGPASGWIKALRNEGSSLYAEVDLTPTAREKVASGEYRFFSPEYHPAYVDPETGANHGPTLFGGALTNRPFFRGMQAIQCSEASGVAPAPATIVPGPAGAPTGASPQESSMSTETNPAAAPVQGAEPPAAGTITAAEVQRMQDENRQLSERLTAVEVRNAALQAAEDRRLVEDQIGSLSFSEGARGKVVLAPAARTSLVDALVPLTAEQRKPILEALGSVQFAELGERGLTLPETNGAIQLSESEERMCAETARETGGKLDEIKARYIENKREHLAKMARL